MAGNRASRQRTERQLALLAEPECLGRVCEFVANTGSLSAWCKEQDVRFNEVHSWVLGDPIRSKAYALAMEARTARLTNKVSDRMEAMMDADVRDAYGKGGKLLAVHKLPAAVAASVVEVSDSPRGGTKLKLVAPNTATELMGRHLGMFRDKLEVSGEVGIAGRLAAARQRVRGK